MLVVRRYDVLEGFVQRVRRLDLAKPAVSAADVARPIAACLTWMARALGGMHTDPMDCAKLAYEYVDDRRRIGYELPAVLTELGLFRETIIDVAERHGVRDAREVDRATALVHRVLVDVVTRWNASKAGATQRMAAFRRSR